ncbi:MAG: AAA family ATPase [Bacillota bacterium]
MAARPELDTIFHELDELVGLREVKHLIRELTAFIEIQGRRGEMGLATEPLALHMVFQGNPGTGKTTVARLLGRLFKEINVLPKGHLVEVERADLVGEYIGHTAQRTREQIKRALGGILFIDEAYSLARGGEKDFGKEAIDTLVKAMEDHKDELVIVLAGYHLEMQSFLQTNPGLHSRFPIRLEFQDFNLEELLEIASRMLRRRQYRLTQTAQLQMVAILEARVRDGSHHTGNARLVRNIIEKSIRRQALRLVNKGQPSREELMTIEDQDLRDPV